MLRPTQGGPTQHPPRHPPTEKNKFAGGANTQRMSPKKAIVGDYIIGRLLKGDRIKAARGVGE